MTWQPFQQEAMGILTISLSEAAAPTQPLDSTMAQCSGVCKLTDYWPQQMAQVLPALPDVVEAGGCQRECLGQGAGGGASQGPNRLRLPGKALHEGMPGPRAHQAHADGGLLRQHRQQPGDNYPMQIHLACIPAFQGMHPSMALVLVLLHVHLLSKRWNGMLKRPEAAMPAA